MNMESHLDELKRLELMVIPLRDCQAVRLPEVQQVYGMAFDDEPVVMVLLAA